MPNRLSIRPINKLGYEAWLPLWDGYNAFYGRHGPTTLDLNLTQTTWARFLNDDEAERCLLFTRSLLTKRDEKWQIVQFHRSAMPQ